jgi:hypothetical protein
MSAEERAATHEGTVALLELERPSARLLMTREELEQSLEGIAEELAGYPT